MILRPRVDLTRIVVAIDPAVTAGEKSDETGIVVAGKGDDRFAYVLDDLSCRESPDAWARIAVRAYHQYQADKIIAEVNNGGDLVERVIRTVDPRVNYATIRATRGKVLRAEPVAALYEQGRVFHVREFEQLESQMLAFVPGVTDRGRHDDRLDAMVYAITELMLGGGGQSGTVIVGGSRPQMGPARQGM